MTHKLEVQLPFANAIVSGDMTFMVCPNDCGFQKDDIIKFKVHDEYGNFISGHFLEKETYKITYVLSGYGIKDGYVAFAIKQVRGEI